MWFLAGIFLMVLALAIHFGYILKVGVGEFLLRGYYVSSFMNRYVSNVRLWVLQPQIFAVGFGVYMVSVALTHNKLFYGKLGLSLFSIYMFLLIIEGARTPLIIVGVILLLVRHYLIKPVKLKWLITLGVLSMVLFGAIGVVRGVTAFDISKMISELQYARKTGQTHWYDPVVEMGGSVRTVNLATTLVPEKEPYWYGRSYVQSVTHIVPYLQGLLGRYLGASPSMWLTWTLFGRGAAGTGFSIAAEGYINFGLIGVFFHMFFLGVLLRRIYVWFASVIAPSRCVLFFASTGIFLFCVRGHTNTLFAPLFQIFVLGWLLKTLFGEREQVSAEQLNSSGIVAFG